jgi:restriction endonuclease Mrr
MSKDNFQLLLLPLLESLGDGKVYSSIHIQDELSKYVDYSDEKLRMYKGINNKPAFLDAVMTTKEHLMRAGLIEILNNDQWRITSLGKIVLTKRLNSLNLEFLKRLPPL